MSFVFTLWSSCSITTYIMSYLKRAENILQQINELASISDDAFCISRSYGTKAFIEGRNKVQQWMNEAGLQTRIDTIGNIRGKLLSSNPSAKTLVIASHIDTVINAGKFDGPLGVLMGLELLRGLIESKKELPFHIELIGFCDEEGVRFHTTYLGSKAIVGSFDKNVLTKKDSDGISIEDVINQMGGNAMRLDDDRIEKDNWLGYFEIHIEQGPVLYEKNIPVGIVTAIAGQRRAEIIFKGVAGHAGTVPMDMRNDALCCAAKFIVKLEKFAKRHEGDIVATVGRLNVVNAASNVIPGEVICSLDLRSADNIILSGSYQKIKLFHEAIAKKRGIETQWNLVQETIPTICDSSMNELLATAIKESGHEVIELVSGAGHDAVPIAAVSPVAMLFVRCFKGISHNPLEDVDLKDISAAIEVSSNFIHLMEHKGH